MKASEGPRRVLRFEKALRQELGLFLLTGFKHDIPGMASISRIMASPDLKSAKVYVSVMGSKEEQDAAVELMQHNRHEFQSHLAHALDLRFCPRLSFFLDEAGEKMLRVERIIHELSTANEQSRTNK